MGNRITEKQIQKAFDKVCHRRKEYSCNNDIWDLRHNWKERKSELLDKLNDGTYRFDSAKEFTLDEERFEIWSSVDAIVIETLTILLKEDNLIKDCSSFHLKGKGKGGVKAAVCKVKKNLKKFKYVMRTDVKKYYASMNHDRLLEILRTKISEASVLSLLYQFMKRTIYRNGFYKTVEKGICRGSSLSPLLGALYLEELDIEMKGRSSFYIRYMDDVIVMAKNKWSFRRFIKKVNRIFERLALEKAGDKTFIGKIERGFDFLGFYFSREGLTVSKKSVCKFAENVVLRLTEHGDSVEGKITPL
ncbi:MAG: reverse transcriptase [bacterium]|nr:reverse transcriptase [bacterium]